MKMSKILTLLAILSIIPCILLSYFNGKKEGYHNGCMDAMDTVQKIMNKQISSDSNTMTRIKFSDTLYYDLSNKKRR